MRRREQAARREPGTKSETAPADEGVRLNAIQRLRDEKTGAVALSLRDAD
jgi:hypothetical protein